MEKQAKTKRRECHLEKVRECQRQGFKKYKQANPDKVQLSYKRNRACHQNVMDSLQHGINDDDNSHALGRIEKGQKVLEVEISLNKRLLNKETFLRRKLESKLATAKNVSTI